MIPTNARILALTREHSPIRCNIRQASNMFSSMARLLSIAGSTNPSPPGGSCEDPALEPDGTIYFCNYFSLRFVHQTTCTCAVG